MRMVSDERFLTPPEIAKRLRVSPAKVLTWIRKGELRAVNLSNSFRPRYRVCPDALEDFLQSREVQPPPPRQRRRRQPPEGGPIDSELGKKLAKSGKAKLVGNKYYRVHDGITLYF